MQAARRRPTTSISTVRPIAVLNGSTLYYLHDDMLGTPQLANRRQPEQINGQASYEALQDRHLSAGRLRRTCACRGSTSILRAAGTTTASAITYQLGRYAEPDPLGRAGRGNNLYAYVNDNPVFFDDPFGLASPSIRRGLKYIRVSSAMEGLSIMAIGEAPVAGGQETPYEDLSPSDQANLAPPIDAQDACDEQHDKCYSRSRVANNGTSSTIGRQCAPGIQAPAGQYITSLSYNQDGRLASVNAGAGALASYIYDGFEQRLIKTVSGSYGEIYQYGQDGALLEETLGPTGSGPVPFSKRDLVV